MQHITPGRVMSDQSLNQMAVQLHTHIRSVLKAAVSDLERQDIPPAVIGYTMQRLGMQIIYATDGTKQLRETTGELLDEITQRRD